MTAQAYQRLIIKGIEGLSPHLLAEIADFIYFVRHRTLHLRNDGEAFPIEQWLEMTDAATRVRFLKTVTARMQQNPLPAGAPRWTREELHARC